MLLRCVVYCTLYLDHLFAPSCTIFKMPEACIFYMGVAVPRSLGLRRSPSVGQVLLPDVFLLYLVVLLCTHRIGRPYKKGGYVANRLDVSIKIDQFARENFACRFSSRLGCFSWAHRCQQGSGTPFILPSLFLLRIYPYYMQYLSRPDGT